MFMKAWLMCESSLRATYVTIQAGAITGRLQSGSAGRGRDHATEPPLHSSNLMPMQPRTRLPLITVALLLVVTAAVAQSALADVTGKWKFSVVAGGRTSESTVTFKQSGDSLSGVIETEQAGSRELVGSVSKDTVRFAFAFEMQGNKVEIRAAGIVRDSVTIDGEFALPNGVGAFPFTAKRLP